MSETGAKDFAELIAAFNAHGVEYIVVGGYALAFHGHVRATKDLDILIRPSPKNAGRLLAALDAFGFGSIGLKPEDFRPENVIQLGYPPNRVDLIMSISGVEAEAAWEGRVMGRFLGEPVPFLSKEHFLANKRASGRKQDLADIEALGG